jgi:ferric-dicitrate binding protein FerR (iron transport regulator)
MTDDRESGGVRRSSGVRFAMETPRKVLMFAGFVACVAAMPFAIAASKLRGPVAQRVDAGASVVTVRLPDSSRVVLGRGSSLRYRPDFAQRRVLWLIGRATLEIVPGPAFSLWTETAFLNTLDGSFDVQTTGLDTTVVRVRAGTVRLRALNEDNDPAYRTATIGPGQLGFSIKMVGARIAP